MKFRLGQSMYLPKPGLNAMSVVGAGGRGAISAGYLKRVAELGLLYQLIYGTSSGSMNAALYVQGDLDLLEWIWMNISNKDVRNLDLLKIFTQSPGFYDFSPLLKTLKKYIDPDKIKASKSEFFVPITDLTANAPRLVDMKKLPCKEDTYKTILASASIPVLVSAVDGRFVDGGLMSNACVIDPISRGAETVTVLMPAIPNSFKMTNMLDSVEVLITLPMWAQFIDQKEAIEDMPAPKPKLIVVAPSPSQKVPGSLFNFDQTYEDRRKAIDLGYFICKETLG